LCAFLKNSEGFSGAMAQPSNVLDLIASEEDGMLQLHLKRSFAHLSIYLSV
jgi:hypothetical protein